VASFNAGDLRGCLTRKLRATEQTGHDHVRFAVVDNDGRVVAVTQLSHSWRGSTPVSSNMVATIQRQLRLLGRPREFEDVIRCPLTRDQYLALVAGGDPGA